MDIKNGVLSGSDAAKAKAILGNSAAAEGAGKSITDRAPKVTTRHEAELEAARALVTIRKATPADMDRIVEVENQSWPAGQTASREQLERRMSVFPEGFIVAEKDGEIIGFATMKIINFDPYAPPKSWSVVTDEGWANDHKPNGNAIYGISTCVHPDHRKTGAGTLMVDESCALVKKLGLNYRVTGCRMPGYREYSEKAGQIDGEHYAHLYRPDGTPVDPTIRRFHNSGFRLLGVVENYYPVDAASGGYGAIMVWKNPEKEVVEPRVRVERNGGLIGYRGMILNPKKLGPDGFDYYQDGGLVVDARGRIVKCGTWEAVKTVYNGSLQEVKFPRSLIIPGFVDTHQHVSHTDTYLHITELKAWLDEIRFFEMRFSNRQHAMETAERFFQMLINAGTTTVAAHASYYADATDGIFEVASRMGIRFIGGLVMADRGEPADLRGDPQQLLKDSEALFHKWNGFNFGQMRYAYTPRSAWACSPEFLRSIAEAAGRLEARIQSHVGEDPEVLHMVRERSGKADPQYGDVDEFLATGIIKPRSTPGYDPKTILAHAVHVSREHVRLLAECGATVAHCPRSNRFGSELQMDLHRLSSAGISVGLGTDLGAGKGIGMFKVMEPAENCYSTALQMAGVYRNVHPAEIIYLATLGGAEALHIRKEVGNFKHGKQADFAVVEIPLDLIPSPRENGFDTDGVRRMLSHVIFNGDERMITQTFVRGKPLKKAEGENGGAARAVEVSEPKADTQGERSGTQTHPGTMREEEDEVIVHDENTFARGG